MIENFHLLIGVSQTPAMRRVRPDKNKVVMQSIYESRLEDVFFGHVNRPGYRR